MLILKQIIDYDCDVLIAGGGPSGSALAFHLAKMGAKVIVVEAEKFPRDKVCGDGVSPIALAELDRMGITQTKNFAKANEIKKVGLFLKNDQVYINLSKPEHLKYHARIIPRIELDDMIYGAAKKQGAIYMESSRVLNYSISPTAAWVTIKTGAGPTTIKSRLIVGADGSRSTIARQLRGVKPADDYQLLGLRAYYNNVNGPTDRVDIYFSEAGFPGIFWMFPKGKNDANVGMALISKTFPKKPDHIKNLLQDHIANHSEIQNRIGNGTLEAKMEGWPITFFNTSQKLCGNRVLLVGEAAGLINPLSGDGIQYALLSSGWAAEAIGKCLGENDFSESHLNSYVKRVHKEVGFDFALSNLLVQFPKNKTLTKVWMQILNILIARAKRDKAYADIIAGIFEGTYPSYKALTIPFIFKSIKQGGVEVANALMESLKNPEGIIDDSAEAVNSLFKIVEEVKADPVQQLKWAGNTLSKTAAVAGHVVSRIDLAKLRGR
ncbi:geranylgeranyl reductase family protein [Aequorivita sp. SDUM287046]|uniref:Geranylgeranyl reductase family protein n=1 Tax=Aequorivita aurantiaca TaxID=3053356 RepID=A0ABT8DGF1_9FLAO|nr:geranylgeranyl reductase family protein [Aequorivita aurantiaca]MDN3724455.1 geranylgeranyl reductase family protein [Aequorivita aurantiaca]